MDDFVMWLVPTLSLTFADVHMGYFRLRWGTCTIPFILILYINIRHYF